MEPDTQVTLRVLCLLHNAPAQIVRRNGWFSDWISLRCWAKTKCKVSESFFFYVCFDAGLERPGLIRINLSRNPKKDKPLQTHIKNF